MPFDDTNYRDPTPESPPKIGRQISKRGETILLNLLLLLAIAALVLPISAGSFSDIVKAFGHK